MMVVEPKDGVIQKDIKPLELVLRVDLDRYVQILEKLVA